MEKIFWNILKQIFVEIFAFLIPENWVYRKKMYFVVISTFGVYLELWLTDFANRALKLKVTEPSIFCILWSYRVIYISSWEKYRNRKYVYSFNFFT